MPAISKGSRINKFAEVRAKYAMYSADLSEQVSADSETTAIAGLFQGFYERRPTKDMV